MTEHLNRRSFLKTSALALFGFTVLPPAKTYERIWRARTAPGVIINPAWVNAPFEQSVVFDQVFKHLQLVVLHSASYKVQDAVPDPYPRRFYCDNGVYREVHPFTIDTSRVRKYFS